MSQPARARAERPQLTEQQALALLRQNAGIRWFSTLLTCVLAAVVMTVLRRFLLDAAWDDAFIYGALFGLFFMLLQLFLEWRRTRRMPAGVADWTHLEKASVVSRQGDAVTIRGRRGTVVAPLHNAWQLSDGDGLWVGPGLREGEQIVAVRSASGPMASGVHAPTGPSRRA